MPMNTKLGRVMTYLKGLPLIKSLCSSVTWSCDITQQNKNIISPLAQYLWLPNLAGWNKEPAIRSSHSKSCMIFQQRDLVRSIDKLDTLYRYMHQANG